MRICTCSLLFVVSRNFSFNWRIISLSSLSLGSTLAENQLLHCCCKLIHFALNSSGVFSSRWQRGFINLKQTAGYCCRNINVLFTCWTTTLCWGHGESIQIRNLCELLPTWVTDLGNVSLVPRPFFTAALDVFHYQHAERKGLETPARFLCALEEFA